MNPDLQISNETAAAPGAAPKTVAAPRRYYWTLRREFWENRYLYLAPLTIAGIYYTAFLIELIHSPAQRFGASKTLQHTVINVGPYNTAAGLMMFTAIIVSLYYCLEALYSERRDRSILFWKSLPVSDRMTVLAKISLPVVIIPILASIIGAILQLLMLLTSSIMLLAQGQSAAMPWARQPWLHTSLLLLYHILTYHGIWPAPIYGWLILVSAWPRRAPLLWAVLPVLALGAMEETALHSAHFLTFLWHRLMGMNAASNYAPGNLFPTNPLVHIKPGPFVSSPGLWLGLLVTAGFLYLAVRVRRRQE